MESEGVDGARMGLGGLDGARMGSGGMDGVGLGSLIGGIRGYVLGCALGRKWNCAGWVTLQICPPSFYF